MATQPIQTGRRAAPRLRLSLPGKFIAVRGNLNCILTNISQTGALLALNEVLEVGAEGFLRCGPIDHFVIVTRKEAGLNAVEFDEPVSHDFILQMRAYQDTFEDREIDELMMRARDWAQGGQ